MNATGAVGSTAGPGTRIPAREAARCAARTVRLLAVRRLHIGHSHVGSTVSLPDGRRYLVFRETSCDADTVETPVVLAVWFRLRFIPPGAHIRRRLFERLCIVNTFLFAGIDGYLVKLWMVNPTTSDYAGLYSWTSAAGADRYGRYITSILRPLSCAATIGYEVFPDRTLTTYLDGVSTEGTP
jgi:hypothetical protein